MISAEISLCLRFKWLFKLHVELNATFTIPEHNLHFARNDFVEEFGSGDGADDGICVVAVDEADDNVVFSGLGTSSLTLELDASLTIWK